jgi:hypothetical protein
MARAYPKSKRAAFFSDLKAANGKLLEIRDPRMTAPGTAVFLAIFERRILDLQLSLDKTGRIAGLSFLPKRPNRSVPDRNQVELSLPVKGAWVVVSGGPKDKDNRHFTDPAQRFAVDLSLKGEDGGTHHGDGRKNEDYWSWGKEVYAPADGYVVEAVDGVHDNVPGFPNPYAELGNHVIIRHGDYEVSVLAHLRQGSVSVKRGDKLSWGDLVGAIGNSGDSTEPHLHYHLQNAERFEDGSGVVLAFRKLVQHQEDGSSQKMRDYSPVKGDIISR